MLLNGKAGIKNGSNSMKHDLRYGGMLAGDEEWEALLRSIKSSINTGNWQAGEEAKKMEEEAAEFLGVKHGILTTSGSCAGLLALSALELPRGSEVIISAVTFPTIFNIIIQSGLVPVVVDAKVGTYNFDVDEVERAITKKTKAIIAVHAVGNPCDMPLLMEVVKDKDIYVIEDNCDGWGSSIGRRRVGSFGHISITSFHAAHIVSTGCGGGVFTDSNDLAQKVRQYRDWGRQTNTDEPHKIEELPADYNPRFVYDKIGYNFQILDLQAAMGRVQLRKTEEFKEKRRFNWAHLYRHLLAMTDKIKLSDSIDGADVCWFAFPITYMGDRGRLTAHLEKNGIETRSMLSGDITKHPAYKDSKYRIGPGGLREAQIILHHSFWITCHPRLTTSDLDYIIKVFHDFFA